MHNSRPAGPAIRPEVRFNLQRVFALTACIAIFSALVAYEIDGIVIFWLAWGVLWLLGVFPGSQWRYVWWSWAAAGSPIVAVLVQVASGYTISLAFGYEFPKLPAYLLIAILWLAFAALLFGLWCAYKSWRLRHFLARTSAVLSGAANLFLGGVYIWKVLS